MITRFATLTTRLSVAFALLFTIAACGGGNGGGGFFPGGGGGGVGNPVTIITTSLANAVEGIPYSGLVVADGGEEPYSWTVVDNGGTGFIINNEGILTGIASKSGDYGLTLQVADSASSTDKASFILTVTGDTPQPLAIATNTLPPAEEGEEYLALLEAVGGAGDYQWAMVSDGNSGLQLRYDGVLSGTAPADEGQYPITVSVMDETGIATSILILIVTGPSSPVAITTTSLPGGTVEQSYATVLAASGGDKPYAWTLVSNGGQSGLSLSAAGILSGSPALAGAFGIIVKVSDGTNTDESALPLTIVPQGGEGELLTITTTSLPVANRVLYSAVLEASGGEKPYSWSGGDTSFPGTGFTVINSGSITGNTNDVSPGLYSYTVTVADSEGESETRNYIIDIPGGDQPPVAILTGDPLPDATETVTYTLVMRAVGGEGDLDWSVLQTTNDAGVTITDGPSFDEPGSEALGVLYWSAADIVEGNYSVTIQVKDRTISADVITFSLRALDAPIRITTTELTAIPSGTSYTQTILSTGGGPTRTWEVLSTVKEADDTAVENGPTFASPGNPSTGALYWDVANIVSGRYRVTIEVSSIADGVTTIDVKTFDLEALLP